MEYSKTDHLLVSQTRILYYQSITTVSFPVFACLAICLLLWDVSARSHLITWAVIVLLFTLLRYILLWQQRRHKLTPENAGRRLDIFTAGALFSGLLWGSAPIILVPYRPDALLNFTLYNGLTLLIICGLVAGAVISYSVSRWVLIFYAFPALVPPAFYLIWLGDVYNTFLGGFVLLYLVFIAVTSYRLNTQYLFYVDLEYRYKQLQLDHQKLKEQVARLIR